MKDAKSFCPRCGKWTKSMMKIICWICGEKK